MSTNQKHTVATDALETLGTFPIPDNSGRDAIHLAVEPVVAGARLVAGEKIRIEDGKAVAASAAEAIGIVDPFVPGVVGVGQRFWLVVLPRTITSLRHVWSHPLFAEEPASAYHADADEHYVADKKAASEKWLKEFAERNYFDYHDLVGSAVRGGDESWDDDYLHFNGRDAHGEIPPEFWNHVETVTGQTITHRPSYFSCSC